LQQEAKSILRPILSNNLAIFLSAIAFFKRRRNSLSVFVKLKCRLVNAPPCSGGVEEDIAGMNTTIYQFGSLSDELSELLQAFELKLNRSKEKLDKAQEYQDVDRVIALRKKILDWNEDIERLRG